MHIDRRLNLILTVEREDGSKVYVHAAPISRESFDSFFLIMATAYGEIMGTSLRMLGNRVAMKLIKKIAENQEILESVEKGLIAEIRRLANVVIATDKGWETIPLQQAVTGNLIDEEEADEIENSIAFFTCFWHVTPKAQRAKALPGLANVWGARISSSDCTALVASLATSTETASTGPKPEAPLSSIPH